ncbi:MAG: hypothetical protein ACI8T1_000682 [Verrucomicrobiales bacterium]|jgi:hypothetical protein
MQKEGLKDEVDPQLGPDGQTIDLSISTELMKHSSLSKYGQNESEIAIPLFHTERVATNVTTMAGNHLLLGLHSKRTLSGQNQGTYTLVFVTCSIKTP